MPTVLLLAAGAVTGILGTLITRKMSPSGQRRS
jgi:hypothetical protein